MTSYDRQSITYDTIRNPLNDGNWTYIWEAGKQLSSMTCENTNVSYKYNDQGIRTEKTVNGVTTKYHLVGDRVTYETNGTDKIYYTYDSQGSLVSMNLNGTEYYYMKNGQRDIIRLFDGAGTVVVTYTYQSFGKLFWIQGSLAGPVGLKNPYRYRGYRYDTETRLYYLQSRYYNPEWGRFISADDISYSKLGELLSFNLFAYCNNNPVNMVDSDGRCGWAIFGAGIGGLVGGISQAVGNVVSGKRGWQIFDGVLGATLGGAVSGVILSIDPAATVLAASLGSAVQTLTNGLIDRISSGEKIDKKFLWNMIVQTVVSAILGATAGKYISEAIPINSGWIKPEKVMSILTGKYGTAFRDQTIMAGIFNTVFNVLTNNNN